MRNLGLLLFLSVLSTGLIFLQSIEAKADDDKVIKFAVCNLKAYEDSTKVLAEEVAKLGYTLDYIFLADNTQINEAVENGEYFANYHQHTPYMNGFNRTHGGHLAAAFKVFTDKAGIYSKKYKDIKELPEGARIILANDAANNFRGLVMLADAGLLKLKSGVEPDKITQNDVIENPKKYQFIEVDYTMLARALEEADAGFLYATVAAEIDLDPREALLTERPELQAADILAVREENLDSEKTKILKQAYYSDAIKKALKDSYDGRDVLEPAW